jgi:hypothetical protein
MLLNAWTEQPIILELGMYIMLSEPTSTVHFIQPSINNTNITTSQFETKVYYYSLNTILV